MNVPKYGKTMKLPVIVPKWRTTTTNKLKEIKKEISGIAPIDFIKSLDKIIAEASKSKRK
jgi:hypothetical protein